MSSPFLNTITSNDRTFGRPIIYTDTDFTMLLLFIKIPLTIIVDNCLEWLLAQSSHWPPMSQWVNSLVPQRGIISWSHYFSGFTCYCFYCTNFRKINLPTNPDDFVVIINTIISTILPPSSHNLSDSEHSPDASAGNRYLIITPDFIVKKLILDS